jgi:hypothetical protein
MWDDEQWKCHTIYSYTSYLTCASPRVIIVFSKKYQVENNCSFMLLQCVFLHKKIQKIIEKPMQGR